MTGHDRAVRKSLISVTRAYRRTGSIEALSERVLERRDIGRGSIALRNQPDRSPPQCVTNFDCDGACGDATPQAAATISPSSTRFLNVDWPEVRANDAVRFHGIATVEQSHEI